MYWNAFRGQQTVCTHHHYSPIQTPTHAHNRALKLSFARIDSLQTSSNVIFRTPHGIRLLFFPNKNRNFHPYFFFFPPSLIFTSKWFANESKVHANMLFVPFAYIFDEYFLLRSWKLHVSIQKIYIDNISQFPCAWNTCKHGDTFVCVCASAFVFHFA